MCACEGSSVCSKCQGTPFAPYYEAQPELTPEQFERLTEADDRSMSLALWGLE